MRKIFFVLCGLLLACSGSTEPAGAAPTTDAGTATNTDAGDADPDAKLLASCTSTFSDDTPALFKQYFRCVDVSVDGTDVVVATKSLPPYRTYYYGSGNPSFVEFDTSRGSQYRANPNVLSEQHITLRIPMNPVAKSGLIITKELVDGQSGTAVSTNDYRLGPIGIALNGVSLYSGVANVGDDINQEQYSFDSWNGHPDQRGGYHYHSPSPGPLAVLEMNKLVTTTVPGKAELEFYGVMCDGTVVLGCTELDGSAPVTTDLDAQNGHIHDLRDKSGLAALTGRYHTHLCAGWGDASHIFSPEVQYYDTCNGTQ